MEKMKEIKKKLVELAYDSLMSDAIAVDIAELGQIVDMIKDMSKAIYHCSLVTAMENNCTCGLHIPDKEEIGIEITLQLIIHPPFHIQYLNQQQVHHLQLL